MLRSLPRAVRPGDGRRDVRTRREVVSINARLADVVDRYGPNHLVNECMVSVAAAAHVAQQRIKLATLQEVAQT